MDVTLIERVKPAKTVIGLVIRGMSLKTNFGAKVTVINSVTANAVYRHRRWM